MKLNNLWRLTTIPLLPFVVIGFIVGMIYISLYMGWLKADKFLAWVGDVDDTEEGEL